MSTNCFTTLTMQLVRKLLVLYDLPTLLLVSLALLPTFPHFKLEGEVEEPNALVKKKEGFLWFVLSRIEGSDETGRWSGHFLLGPLLVM